MVIKYKAPTDVFNVINITGTIIIQEKSQVYNKVRQAMFWVGFTLIKDKRFHKLKLYNCSVYRGMKQTQRMLFYRNQLVSSYNATLQP